MTGTAPPAEEAEASPPAEPTAQELAPRRDEASLPERLRPPMPSSGIRGWVGPIIVTIIGGLLRFIELGRPHAIIFDETYYPKSALGMLQYGYEQKVVENANDLILESDGNWRALDLFTGDPEFVVHPPLGKWTIAIGEQIFGATPVRLALRGSRPGHPRDPHDRPHRAHGSRARTSSARSPACSSPSRACTS